MSVLKDAASSRAANAALMFLKEKCAGNAEVTRKSLLALLREEGVSEKNYLEVLDVIKANTRIAIHFHPERLTNTGISVAQGLFNIGRYLTQFETGISSGSPTGFAGGVRDEWEHTFFGACYHQSEVGVAGRPKYGALMLATYPDGPAPRFGSSYLVLHSDVNKRSTYTYGGNQDDLAWKRTGSWDHLDSIFLPVLKDLKERGSVLGSQGVTVKEYLELLKVDAVRLGRSSRLSNALDSYVEAQIHGPICLASDVEKIVVDHSFHSTKLEGILVKLATRYNLELNWYNGYTAEVSAMPAEFRGYEIGSLINRIAGDGHLTAAKIGTASNSFHRTPDDWAKWRNSGEALTYFRRVWHALVYHGQASS